MEIHSPHRAIGSLKEALVHLTLITVGVLIALSFEGIASWREHRALVREARANLANEIRDNMNELSSRLKKIPDEQRNIDRARQAVATLTEHHKLDMKNLELSFVTAELRDASHVTAQITGASSRASRAPSASSTSSAARRRRRASSTTSDSNCGCWVRRSPWRSRSAARSSTSTSTSCSAEPPA